MERVKYLTLSLEKLNDSELSWAELTRQEIVLNVNL